MISTLLEKHYFQVRSQEERSSLKGILFLISPLFFLFIFKYSIVPSFPLKIVCFFAFFLVSLYHPLIRRLRCHGFSRVLLHFPSGDEEKRGGDFILNNMYSAISTSFINGSVLVQKAEFISGISFSSL
uniref:Uncharacterized protein n=1 Tax=Caenorhabditis tropicalis TaxID=1561998 RepID=A0A1I7U9U5_9PELO